MGKQRSNDEWKGWCLGGVWEAFMRVGGRLQMTKMCVFCWLFHSNGRRETEGEKGGGGEFDDAKWEKEGGGRGGGQGADTNSVRINPFRAPTGR